VTKVHLPSGNDEGAGRAGGGGHRGYNNRKQEDSNRARGADGDIGETIAAVIVFIVNRQAAEAPQHNLATVTGQDMAEFVYQD
jgi:hypothetical protein